MLSQIETRKFQLMHIMFIVKAYNSRVRTKQVGYFGRPLIKLFLFTRCQYITPISVHGQDNYWNDECWLLFLPVCNVCNSLTCHNAHVGQVFEIMGSSGWYSAYPSTNSTLSLSLSIIIFLGISKTPKNTMKNAYGRLFDKIG